jgi:hypothetical protein
MRRIAGGPPDLTRTDLASTTLSISPDSMTATASATEAAQSDTAGCDSVA